MKYDGLSFPEALERLANRAGIALPQRELTPEKLADLLQNTERTMLVERALAAKKMEKTQATEALVEACQKVIGL